MPISSLLETAFIHPSMLHRPRTNPIFTKQAQLVGYPLFTKYDQQRATTNLSRSVQKPHFHHHLNLGPDGSELETKIPNDHVHNFLQTASDFTKTQNKQLLSVIIGVISVCYSYEALAASGGVMGGDSFSSYSSSDKSSSSSSRSSSSSSWSSASPSSSSSSWSSTSPSSSSSSWTSASPSSSSWSSTTDYKRKCLKPSPSTSSKSYEYTMSTSVAPQIASTTTRLEDVLGFSIVTVSILVIAALVFFSIKGRSLYYSHTHPLGPSKWDFNPRVPHERLNGVPAAPYSGGGIAALGTKVDKALEKTSVVKLQVALLGSARSFQTEINQIAKVADTSTRRGHKNVLIESSLALLRHSAFWASSHLSVSEEQYVKDGEKRFSKLSFEERSKFDQETVVNLKHFKKEEKLRQQFDDPSHDFIVVTFLVAVLGILELPSVESRADLTAIVQKLNNVALKELLAVQVLWTPQNENDTLSSQRVLKDYPLLQPLK